MHQIFLNAAHICARCARPTPHENLFQSQSFCCQKFPIKVSDDGRRISGGRGLLAIFPLVWITEVEAEKLRSRPNDPVLAPIVPYPMQPTKQGRLVRAELQNISHGVVRETNFCIQQVFISGPPGCGKSTIGSTIAGSFHLSKISLHSDLCAKPVVETKFSKFRHKLVKYVYKYHKLSLSRTK